MLGLSQTDQAGTVALIMCELSRNNGHYLVLNMGSCVQAEAADGTSFSDPLRRYANSIALDTRLSHRGTLTNGELKAGAPINSNPQVILRTSCC